MVDVLPRCVRARQAAKQSTTESAPSVAGNAAGASAATVSLKQPTLLTGGTLRQYQLEGYTWLSKLCVAALPMRMRWAALTIARARPLLMRGVTRDPATRTASMASWQVWALVLSYAKSWLRASLTSMFLGVGADEMGLGKTIQVIALVAHLREMKVDGPVIVVAPLSTVPNWIKEFNRYGGGRRVLAVRRAGSRLRRGVLRCANPGLHRLCRLSCTTARHRNGQLCAASLGPTT